jgi:hypothetical protein
MHGLNSFQKIKANQSMVAKLKSDGIVAVKDVSSLSLESMGSGSTRSRQRSFASGIPGTPSAGPSRKSSIRGEHLSPTLVPGRFSPDLHAALQQSKRPTVLKRASTFTARSPSTTALPSPGMLKQDVAGSGEGLEKLSRTTSSSGSFTMPAPDAELERFDSSQQQTATTSLAALSLSKTLFGNASHLSSTQSLEKQKPGSNRLRHESIVVDADQESSKLQEEDSVKSKDQA